MRLLFLFLLLVGVASTTRAQLAELSPDTSLVAFEGELQTFMTATRNNRARDAYANFTGVLHGGGFTAEQQQRIVATTVKLAALKLQSDRGIANYLDVHAFLQGKEKERQLLFRDFHDMLGEALAQPEVSVAELNNAMANALVYLESGRLDTKPGPHGWKVAGGKPHFTYSGAPVLRIDTVHQLLGSTTGDSIAIQETQLHVDLGKGAVTGKGGRTDWRRVGLPSEVFVRLVDYRFDADRELLTSDSAQFQYPAYFGDRILYGRFKDRLQSGGARPAGDVPSFESTNGYVDINDIGEGMSLRGNFELRASRVYALSDAGRRAVVTLNIDDGQDGRKVRGLSKQFILEPAKRITAQKVDLTVFFGQDSLYHPSISIDVDVPARSVSLNRTQSSSDRLPFYHSGNRFNIDANNISVYLDRDSAVVGRRTVSFQEKGDVIFESENFFSSRDYQQIQALSGFNPLEVIYRYQSSLYDGGDTINIQSLATQFRPDLTGKDIESVIFDLQDRGFLSYDGESGKIAVKPKLAHFVLSEREAKDYDRLRLISQTTVENAFIDLKGGTIRVDGVQPLQLNARKQIAIKPYAEQVSIVGDRNLDFGGQVYAGAAILSGSDFHFRYDPYYIQFDSVDYIDLFLPEGGEVKEGARKLSTASRIEDVSGYLLIDAPKNKSGAEDIAYFPSLQTRGPSYIYYDRADTNSLYSRDSFYFELAPFSLNNLDSLTEMNLGLRGELVSGGIFPRMEQTLSVQDDGSLGFIGTTDSLGASAYGDRGTYSGQVTLNNSGLAGKGTLNYLEAEITSDDIRFGVDSTTTTSESFILNRTVTDERSVPQVEGSRVNVTFRPYGDSLVVVPAEGADFTLYGDADRSFDGTLVLTPTALQGSGTLDWSQARIESDYFSFGADQAMADTATVAIKSQQNAGEIALQTRNVAAEVDYAANRATFRNNGSELATELPYIEYLTSSDRFDWDMENGNITFETRAGKDRFTSINPDQDSLTFTGNSAVYDNLASELTVGGVPFVISADAKIYPADSTLVVQPGARIAQLTGARIVADTLNQYHVINRATVDIAGRKEYTASGYYEYKVGPHTQEFELQNIVGTRVGKGLQSEKATATRAEGQIAEDETFYIDDKTLFHGTISLDAGSAALAFDGYARIEDEKLAAAEWFVVASEADKTNLILNTDGVQGRDGKPLNTGFYLSKPERHVYPSLIQTLHRRVDHPILAAEGVFTYDEDGKRFLFGDSVRVARPEASAPGNLMIYDTESGLISGDGELGIGGRLKYIGMRSYGNIAMQLPEQVAPPEEEDMVSLTEEPAAADSTGVAEAPETLTDNMFLLEEETEDAPATDVTELSLTVDAPEAEIYPETNVELMAVIDLILPERLVQIMATDIISGGYSAAPLGINARVPFATAGINALFPAGPDRERALAGLAADAVDLPPTINRHTFLFSDMKMRWNTDYQSFVSTETLNGLASIGGQGVSRRIESYLEVKMTTGGDDRLYLFIKSPSETYYFFGFKDGILNLVSNNNSFMNAFRELKPKDVVLEMEDGQTYEILEVTPGTAQTFLRRAQAAFETVD
ncbi:hypothetical protein [Lewinella sp. JB7]|uniref:hypothetical protein n=1 Tax=Lewinella sp. JB7 TaxID=2962887 RepID=UPI0020C94755|nr:hypothetical protein [Lewinella sp. JB7]MCP9235200.1 hypothetical protein [Lewinella sp. JB7]